MANDRLTVSADNDASRRAEVSSLCASLYDAEVAGDLLEVSAMEAELNRRETEVNPLWRGLVPYRVLFARAPVSGRCFFGSVNTKEGTTTILRGVFLVCGFYHSTTRRESTTCWRCLQWRLSRTGGRPS